MAISTNGLQLVRLAGAAFNQQLSASDYSEILASNKTAAELDTWANGAVAAEFKNKTTTDIAKAVLANVGLSSVTGLEAWVAGQLTAGGGVAKAGETLISLLNDYSNMSTTEAIYGASVMTFNAKTANSQALSQTAGTTTGTYAAVSAAVVVKSSTFSLTSNSDNIAGTSGNDTFNAVLVDNGATNTLASFDTVDGGAGVDTLNATLTGTAQTISFGTITGMERASFNINTPTTAGLTTINIVGQTGLTNLTMASANGAGTSFLNLGSIPAITIGQTAAQTVTVDFDTAAIAGTTDNLQITLSGSNAGAITITDDGTAALETITITSTNQANTISALTTTSLGATSLVVKGDQNLTITAAVADTQGTLKTYDASALPSTASFIIGGTIANATVTGGAGNDSITVSTLAGADSLSGGAGNDTFTFGANLTVADTVSGGANTDTLSTAVAAISGLNAASAYSLITEVETLTISDAVATATVSTKFISTGINRVNLNAAVTGANTLALNSGTQTVALKILANLVAGSTQTITSDGTGTTDALTLLVSPTTESAGDFLGSTTSAVTTTGFETVTINTGTFTTNAATAQNLGALNIGSANALNVLGANNLVLAAAFIGKSIDASGATGSAILSMGAATSVDSITGSARGDTIVGDSSSYIDGGAGNDVITGGAGNDTILGGDGVDTITTTGGVDSILGGAGNDIIGNGTTGITLSAGNVINGGDGTDTLTLAANATAATGMGVTSIETLGMMTTGFSQDMTLFVDNGLNTITRVNIVGAISGTFSAVGSATNTIGVDTTGTTLTAFTRLVDTSTDAVTLNVIAGGTVTAATLANENTITVVASTATGAATVTTLTAAQVGTLNLGTANSSTGNYVIGTLTTGSLATVNVNTTGSVNIGATSSTSSRDLTFNAGSASTVSVVGGSGFDSITGGGGADSISGGTGNDTISAAGGADTIVGGAGGDSMTGGSSADQFQVTTTSSIIGSALAIAGATVAAGDTITFANGVDIITDFTAGAGGDVMENTGAVVGTIATGIGVAKDNTGFVTTTQAYLLSGNWNANTKIFTITADAAGADTMVIQGTAATTLANITSEVVLIGVLSSALVAANFS